MIGLINMKSSPREIAKQAIADAAYMCTRTHGDAPEVTIHGRTDLYFPYVSSHISYMLLELLKNSMRATVECHGIDNMPPIRIVIADGEANEDVSDKISLPPPYSLAHILCTYIAEFIARWSSKCRTREEAFDGRISRAYGAISTLPRTRVF